MVDFTIVGAGITGITLAERLSADGYLVSLIDCRDHIGGNCYSEVDQYSGIEFHTYGAHIFHTSDQGVYDYISKFTTLNNYRHTVLTKYNGKVYEMPINLRTINDFFGKDFSPLDAEIFIKSITKEFQDLEDNFETVCLKSVGIELYKAFIEGYTKKQWQCDINELPAKMFSRIPIRFNYNNRYFNDTYEGIPIDGYTNMFSKMTKHVHEIKLNYDYFAHETEIHKNCDTIIFTGPIDRFFSYEYGKLNWRSLRFEKEHYIGDRVGVPVLNIASSKVPHTRVHEHKFFHPEKTYGDKNIVLKEFSVTDDANPYYPVNDKSSKEIFSKYEKLAQKRDNIHFIGRLAEYKYYDMDDAVRAALDLFEKIR